MDPLLQVRDVMSTEVATLRCNDKLLIADDVMRLGRIRHLPVLDENGETIVGIVSQRDLLRGALASALDYDVQEQTKVMKMISVEEVMSGDVTTVLDTDLIVGAARTMIKRKIGCLPVVDEQGALVGILTESDFVQLFVKKE